MPTLIFLFQSILFSFTSHFTPAINDREIIIASNGGHLHGSLLMPDDTTHAVPIVLIIAGSGPTDRDCNSKMLKCDAYKLLAQELQKKGIATFRYDKRGVGASNDFKINEADLRFDDFVNDAVACINYLKADKRFSKVIVAGHSEGALIGLLACKQTKADQYISLCGAGRPIDMVLKEQLAAMPVANLPEEYKSESFNIIDSLKQGLQVKGVKPGLYSLFRPSVQPYMISWMKYNPAKEIMDLKIPTLIIGGEKDLQVKEVDAQDLKKAKSDASFDMIAGMNHIFRTGFKTDDENKASYSNPSLPISPDLVNAIVAFVYSK